MMVKNVVVLDKEAEVGYILGHKERTEEDISKIYSKLKVLRVAEGALLSMAKNGIHVSKCPEALGSIVFQIENLKRVVAKQVDRCKEYKRRIKELEGDRSGGLC